MRPQSCVVALAAFALAAPALGQQAASVATLRVDATPGHALNSFDPDQAIGSSIDVLSRNGIDRVYTPHVIQEALSAGYGPLTYRNNTDLRIAAWHWTENGTWSDPAHKSGYFTGSTELKEPIRYILAYSLPHRGFTRGGGGAPSTMAGTSVTYWKSNPYLTRKFTGESDALHPQWVVVDLGPRNRLARSGSCGPVPTRRPIRWTTGSGRAPWAARLPANGRHFPRGRSGRVRAAR